MKKAFIAALSGAAPFLDDALTEKMAEYYTELVKMNEKLNLTAVTEPAAAAEKHFADSLASLSHIPEKAHVIDIGTGGGFPGVPLKIVRPDIRLTLLDSVEKKLRAVEEMCAETGIGANFLCCRAEDASRDKYRGAFDVVLARAVAPLPVLLELGAAFLRRGGIFIAYKQKDAGDITDVSAAEKLGCVLEEAEEYGEKILLIFKKKERTPIEYPRRYSRIKKAPL